MLNGTLRCRPLYTHAVLGSGIAPFPVSQLRFPNMQVLPVLFGEWDVRDAFPVAVNPEDVVSLLHLLGIHALVLQRHLVLLVVMGSSHFLQVSHEDGNGVSGEMLSGVPG